MCLMLLRRHFEISYLVILEIVINCKKGNGDYVLYHGNLSVSENYNAVKYLATKVFNDLPYKLKVAGLNPPRHLVQLVKNYPNIE